MAYELDNGASHTELCMSVDPNVYEIIRIVHAKPPTFLKNTRSHYVYPRKALLSNIHPSNYPQNFCLNAKI